jgi:hypothetical protein
LTVDFETLLSEQFFVELHRMETNGTTSPRRHGLVLGLVDRNVEELPVEPVVPVVDLVLPRRLLAPAPREH